MPPAIGPTFDIFVVAAGALKFESELLAPGATAVAPEEACRTEAEARGWEREAPPLVVVEAVAVVLDKGAEDNDGDALDALSDGDTALEGAAEVTADEALRDATDELAPPPTLGDGDDDEPLPAWSDTAIFTTVNGTSPLSPKNDTSNKCWPSGSVFVSNNGRFDSVLFGCEVTELGTVGNAKVSTWSMV